MHFARELSLPWSRFQIALDGGLMARLERVLIVGAGMAGLSLAIALRRQGLDPEMVERQAGWPMQGAGIYLVGNAMRALRFLGVADDVRDRGSVIRTQAFMTDRGQKIAEIDTERVWASCGPCVGVRRSDLQEALVKGLGTPYLRFSTTVDALEQGEEEVAVRFSDGSDRVYDLVVGADGIRSSIRQHLFADSNPRFCGQVAWRFLVRCPPVITGWTLFSGRRGAFLFIPVGGGHAYCYADAAGAEAIQDPVEGRVERLRSRFAGYSSPVPEALAELTSPDQIHFGAIEEILQEPCAKGRVLLIGDSAHATSPNMASGAAMAFEDSLVLSRLVGSERGVGQLIHEYSGQRAARVRWVHEKSHDRDRIRNLPPVIRDPLMRYFGDRVYRAHYGPLLADI
jgi:2-polyprenyl-6-methoxyphenol hydroxylase-like FAD-dependent oxidoreductase